MHPTPSTSTTPAPYRRVTSAAQHPDGPSPSKRRKVATPAPASSSSSSFSNRCQSGSGPTSDSQLNTARRESASHLLSVWAALEGKYTRSLDEDDIVDLDSGGFYKNRGVINDKAGTWDIGCFADPKEAQNLAPEEDDEEDDEIGVWGSDFEFDHQFNPVRIPPVREDPEDAEDLRAFLAAERARKALHGVDDDFSGDEAGLNDNGGDDLQLDDDVEESVLEVEAGSACLSPTQSDDDLAGYDDTVGEGALLWEVSSELSNCSEPLGAEGGMASKNLYALPHRHQTPTQLRTPPLSRSSMRPPNVPDLPRKSPQPFRPPVNFPPSPPPQKTSARVPPLKKQASTQCSPDKATKLETPILTDKGKEREISLSPTKNLVAEIMLPMRRASTVIKGVEKTRLENNDTLWKPVHSHQAMSRSARQEKTSTGRRPSKHQPYTSSPLKAPYSSPTPPAPYAHPAPPAPTFQIPHPVLPNFNRESSMTPHPDAQIYIAQAIQSLSYLAFGSPQPPPIVSSSHPSHAQQPFPSSSHPPLQWPYPAPYYPHHHHSYASGPPTWPYPPYTHHYPPTSHPPPTTLPSSSATPSKTPMSTGESPASSPGFLSSPSSGKGGGKRVQSRTRKAH